jgi:alkylation response protein AidB-like acyl-CoA dehydrogenase
MADPVSAIAAEAAEWATANWDPDLTVGAWWDLLFEARYSLPSLPESAYGRGYTRAEEQAVWKGFRKVSTLGPPSGISTMMAAPTIATHGTQDQIDQFIPPILRGEHAWCQLFSEPGAGSDLAGLQTKALRDGDEFRVTGQKVWTSFAHEADYGMLLARTNSDVPKHAGIAWFAFPMLQDGVEVRPLLEINGRAMFNEVFIDDAVVDADAMVGAEGEGWAVGNTTLMVERASLAGKVVSLPYARTGTPSGERSLRSGDVGPSENAHVNNVPDGMHIDQFFAAAARELGRDSAVLQDQLAADYTKAEVLRLLGARARTGAVPAIGNLGKLAMSDIARSNREAGNAAIGAAGMLSGADADAGPCAGDVQRLTINSPAPSIYGGTDQVQRNIIGERMLGLPKEPGPAKDTPFRDLPHN